MTQDRKHILLTTDFSEESFKAFGTVLDLARSLNARVTLLYALPSMDHHPTGTPFVSPVPIPSDEEHLSRARQDLEKLRDRFDGIDVTMDARAGEEVAEVICDYAVEHDVDIITIASHGRSGISRLVMGSIAEQVLRHAKVPVLVVPVKHV